MTMTLTMQARAEGALYGLALGDALGMPTQAMRRDEIQSRYGAITALTSAVDDQPIAPGMPAGAITDDTEQALLLGALLVAGRGRIDPSGFAQALTAWEKHMIEKGSLDLLGPSTKAAILAISQGSTPGESGRYGTTNGAGMRVAPVGIAFRPGAGFLDAVVESCHVTHNTGLGISGAAAVAGVVSACIEGGSFDGAIEYGIEVAIEGERRGHWVAGASIPARFVAFRDMARGLDQAGFADFIYEVVGTSVQSQESVVAALLIADRFRETPYSALCCAAQLGGDTDTVAAMAGAMVGAYHGVGKFPTKEIDLMCQVSSFHPELLATDLLELRTRQP